MITCRPNSRATPYTAPMTPETIMPFLVSGHQVPMMSVVSRMQWIRMMLAAMDVGRPEPMTRPKPMAKLVAARALRSMRFSRYSGRTGRRPSLNTAMLWFARIDANAPTAAMIT